MSAGQLPVVLTDATTDATTDVVAGADAGTLTRSELTAPGIRRRRCGRGFRYFGPDGEPLADPAALSRIKALLIPPAWEDVWICADSRGHIQAVGTDAAVGLAVSQPAARAPSARKRAVARVVQEVTDYLGNTPAVARASYIDPRIIALYERGVTIAPVLADLGKGREFGDAATKGHAERAVLELLSSRAGARAGADGGMDTAGGG